MDPRADTRALFVTRSARLFAYGWLSVVLALYLSEAGLSERELGALLTLTLAGDAAVSLWMTTRADRLGRRRMLVAGAALMVLAAALFASTRSFWLLTLAAFVGVISPSGNEVGPFLAIEQAALAQVVTPARRTQLFAWYNLVGSLATAVGALAGGVLVQVLLGRGLAPLASYRVIVLGYGVVGLALALVFARLGPGVEAPPAPSSSPRLLGLTGSRRVVLGLAGLFSLDSFAGGFVVQALVAFWFHRRFGVAPATLGAIFFGANLLAGVSALSAAALARRIGLLATMVATHLPSNLLLIVVPLMPSLPLAILVLLARFSISQMDVPTRQSYVMAVVAPEERAAASGVTGIARTLGAALAPAVAAPLFASPALASVPFFLAGGLKIAYDLVLWVSFRRVRPREGEAR